jgi:hypothetical protein
MLRVLLHSAAVIASFGLTASNAQATADIYVAHGVPGVDVTVFVNDAPAIGVDQPFTFGTITGEPASLEAGSYNIKVCAFGTDVGEEGCPVIEKEFAIADGETSTIVAHLTEEGGLALSKFGNDLRGTYVRGARLGVRHVAAAPAVDVAVGYTERFENASARLGLNNGAGASSDLPAGPVNVAIVPAGTEGPTVAPTPLELTLEPQQVYFAYAVGSLADGSFTILLQVLEPNEEAVPASDFSDRLRNLRRRLGR